MHRAAMPPMGTFPASKTCSFPSFVTRHSIADHRSPVTPHVSWHALTQLSPIGTLYSIQPPVQLHFHCPPLEASASLKPRSLEQEDLGRIGCATPPRPSARSGSMSPSLHLWALHATIAKLSYNDLLLQALSPSNQHSPRLRKKAGSLRVISQLQPADLPQPAHPSSCCLKGP